MPGNLLKLAGKLSGHKVHGRKEVQHCLQNGDGVPDMHPLRAGKTSFQGRVEVLMPPEQHILELCMLDKRSWLAVLVESECEAKTWLITSSFALLVV